MTDKRSDLSSTKEAQQTGPDVRDPDTVNPAGPPSADMQALIGRQLRAVFDDVAKQPVPDRFIELMKQLDKASAA